MLHVRPRSTFAGLYLQAIDPTGTSRRLHRALRSICRVTTKAREKAIRSMNGVRHFGRYRLVQRNRPSMTLDWVMLLLPLTFQLLALQLLTFTLFSLSMCHLVLLALSFNQLLVPGVSLTLSVDRLGRRMLHCLTNAWKRVSWVMRGGRMGLAIGGRRMRTSMTLAQLRQSGEGVPGRLARVVIGTYINTRIST